MKHLKQSFLSFLVLSIFCGVVLAQNNAAPPQKSTSASGWIGIVTQNLNDLLMKKGKIKDDEGAYVVDVLEDSPADSAGIKKHDVILEFNGKKIEDADDLHKAVQKAVPGETVTCVLLRAGTQQSVSIVIGKKKTIKHHAFRIDVPQIFPGTLISQPQLGLRVLEMGEQLAEYFSAPNNEGVLVEEVTKNSPAAKAGFKAGDVILRAGKRMIGSIKDIRHELRKHEEGDKLEFEILRKGTKKSLEVEIAYAKTNHLSNDLQLESADAGDQEEATFDEIKPNLDEWRLNLDHMRQEMQEDRRGTEIEQQSIRYAPGACESMIL